MARCPRRPRPSAGGARAPIPLTASGRKKSCPCSRGEAAGRLRATTIIEWLEEKFPGRFSASQLRTLQRRLQDWRALNGPDQEVYFPQEHPPGREAQLDFTHCNSLGVTIGGRRYRHLLFQLVLSHSGWRYAEVVAGETFVALKQGLQNALWELGGAPQVIRSDNTSALTHEIKRSLVSSCSSVLPSPVVWGVPGAWVVCPPPVSVVGAQAADVARVTARAMITSIRPIWHCQLVREPRQDATLGIDEGLWDVRWSWCRRSTESGWQHRKRGRLRKMIRAGRSSAQAITRARILIKIDEGWTAPQVATALDVSERTVFRTKRRYAEEGLDEVLRHHNQVNRPRKVDERVEAHLIALACSPVPDGHDHWTMRALAGKVVELGLVESLSPETVRLRLKKTRSSRGSRNNGASPR